jgi:hypothetical protein
MPQSAKIFSRILLFPLGLALLTAVFLFQEGTALSTYPQTMPTPNRLAQPTLPASPSQADYGAQDFWLSCMPCHGDKGQGLTDEFRKTYPPEDQYCWSSGCHGPRPYENGFTLPVNVPPVIGPKAALGKFSNAVTLRAYIKSAMPFWKPGSLTDEEAWRITAFLLRENGISYKGELNASNADRILLFSSQPTPDVTLFPPSSPLAGSASWVILLFVFLLGGITFLWHTLRHRPPQ